MKTITFSILLIVGFIFCSNAQFDPFKFQGYHPETPNSYQFTKFLDFPISEFTGTASFSVPFYTIKLGSLNLPISMDYHTGGIKISEEASMVGLGWNMQFGGIVQQINDEDDFGEGITRARPDWLESAIPTLWETNTYYGSIPPYVNPSHNDPSPIYSPKPIQSFKYFASYISPYSPCNNTSGNV